MLWFGCCCGLVLSLLLLFFFVQELLLQRLGRLWSTPMALFLLPILSSIAAGKQSLGTPVSVSSSSTNVRACPPTHILPCFGSHKKPQQKQTNKQTNKTTNNNKKQTNKQKQQQQKTQTSKQTNKQTKNKHQINRQQLHFYSSSNDHWT